MQECRQTFGVPTLPGPARHFPTGYKLYRGADTDLISAHVQTVVADLGGDVTRAEQAAQLTWADQRVFAGPTTTDVAELPHISDAWCVAQYVTGNAGFVEAARPVGSKHIRHGVVLDWTTRDVAQRLARDRDGVDHIAALDLYGCDPYRVAIEHGAEPDELDELASFCGGSRRGMLAPWGTGRSPWIVNGHLREG